MLTLLLLALCLLIYFPCLYASPIFDDHMMFLSGKMPKWTFYKEFWKTSRWLTDMTFGFTFRPLQKVREEWRNTMIVSAIHLTNTVIHFINSVLVYQIAGYIVGERAMVAALVFAVHPLAAPAIAPIVYRSSALSSTFIFLSIWATLAHHPFLALIPAVFAFFAKEDGIAVFPLIVALTALSDVKTALILLGVYLVGFGYVAKYLWTFGKKLLKNNGDYWMVAAGLPESLSQVPYMCTALVENLKRWPLWALGFDLNPDPPFKTRNIVQAIQCLILVLGLFVVTHIHPALLIVMISPWSASWLFRLPDPVLEHRAYSTILGMALLLSYCPLPLVVPMIGWFAALSSYRCWLQQNEMAYWGHCWNEGSKKLRVAMNLAAACQKYGRLQEAYDWHQQALKIDPKNGVVKMNLALWHEGVARRIRQQAAEPFISQGKADKATADQLVLQAHQHLGNAVILANEGLEAAPLDPSVQKFHGMIQAHANSIGLTVQRVS